MHTHKLKLRSVAISPAERGGVLILTLVILIGVIVCIALAIDTSLLTTSNIQQYQNMQYAADTALRSYLNDCPPNPAVGNNWAVCGPGTNPVTASTDAKTAAENITGSNFYVSSGRTRQRVDASVINFGYCSAIPVASTPTPTVAPTPGPPPVFTPVPTVVPTPPSICSYTCRTLDLTSGDPNDTIVNAVRVKYAPGQGQNVRSFFGNIFGNSDITMKGSQVVAHYDPTRTARMDLNCQRMNEIQLIDSLVCDWTDPAVVPALATPIPVPVSLLAACTPVPPTPAPSATP